MARVVLLATAMKQAYALHEPILTRVWRLIKRLEQWPAVSGVKALKGELAGKYRLRTGDYRVQFAVTKVNGKEVREYVVTVEQIGHRDGFYGD